MEKDGKEKDEGDIYRATKYFGTEKGIFKAAKDQLKAAKAQFKVDKDIFKVDKARFKAKIKELKKLRKERKEREQDQLAMIKVFFDKNSGVDGVLSAEELKQAMIDSDTQPQTSEQVKAWDWKSLGS